jgi:hypothetical protein
MLLSIIAPDFNLRNAVDSSNITRSKETHTA